MPTLKGDFLVKVLPTKKLGVTTWGALDVLNKSFGKQLVFVEENLGKSQQILEFVGVGLQYCNENVEFFSCQIEGFFFDIFVIESQDLQIMRFQVPISGRIPI